MNINSPIVMFQNLGGIWAMDRGQSYCPWGCKELDMTEHAHKS